MGPPGRAVALRRASEPPRRAFPESRSLPKGEGRSRRAHSGTVVSAIRRERTKRQPISLPGGQQVLHRMMLTPTDS